jgi:peroxiredoxin
VVAPEFALDDLNDRVFTLSEYRDRKPVILFFWTTWCSNCREGMRVLNEMYPEIVKDNFEVLSINVGESKSKVARFAQARNFRFKVLLDPSTGTARSFSLVGVPTYVIIDKKGFVRFYDHFFPRDDFKRLVED